MKRQFHNPFSIRLASISIRLASVVALVIASSLSAQDRELFMVSYPNASIEVDGNADDWNLSQFGTYITGGIVPEGELPEDWERLTGTGDIARLGWDDEGANIYYGGHWTGGVLPEDKADNAVRIYARHNETHQYFLADVTDDEINTEDEAAWANDSVEFYLDPEDDGDPTDWGFDVQLVIDAGNQVQVWNSPIDYEEQVEAGVESAVTITETGWLLEVAIDKSVFETPLPSVLGPANDADGRNFGIDFSYRDNDDPEEIGTRNGDTLYTSAYVWADPFSGGGFPSKAASTWGQMIVGEAAVGGDFNGDGMLDAEDINALVMESAGGQNNLAFDLNGDGQVDQDDVSIWAKDLKQTWIGDANLDGEFNSSDFVVIFQAGKFEVDQDAVWTEGDWNGDLRFNSSDLVVAFQDGGFELGPRPAAATVPEPTSLAFPLVFVTFGMLSRRRR